MSSLFGSNDMVVHITGDTSGLDRAFTRARSQAQTFSRRTSSFGRSMKTVGQFDVVAGSTLLLSGRLDTLTESLFGMAGAGGDAGQVAGDMVSMFDDAAMSSSKFSKILGKAGVAGAAVVAGYELSKLIRKIPGWDKAMEGFGGTIHDVAANLGLIHDPTKQFAGKTTPTPGIARYIRGLAGRLEAGGMSPAQAAASISASHPGLARRDVDVWSGVYGAAPAARGRPIVVNLNVDGQKVASVVNTQNARTGKRYAWQTSGFSG